MSLPWPEIVASAVLIPGLLVCAWIFFFRLQWLNRAWERFNFRFTPGLARLLGSFYVVVAIFWLVHFVMLLIESSAGS